MREQKRVAVLLADRDRLGDQRPAALDLAQLQQGG